MLRWDGKPRSRGKAPTRGGFVATLAYVLGAAGLSSAARAEGTTAINHSDNGRSSRQQNPEVHTDPDGTGVSCRVAMCFSGAIRSFVHPAVHRSIRTNLIESIKADGCEVDVFAYVTREDTVVKAKQVENPEFTPNSSDVEVALAVLEPTRLLWHQDQAGIIPNGCSRVNNRTDASRHSARHLWYWEQRYSPEASRSLYWQLYKSLAAYRMALREEKRIGCGFTYDWVIRGRLDVAWARPLPPLRSFSRQAVWFGRHYWPMSDHFALVPRKFSDRFFSAAKTFYACDGRSWPPPSSWWQPECATIGFEESVLFRHLHASEIPYYFYPLFDFVITRGVIGGVCKLGFIVYSEVCSILGLWNALQPPFSRDDCLEALAEYSDLRCRTLFPARGMEDGRRVDAILDPEPRAWEALLDSSPLLEPIPAVAAPGPLGRATEGDSSDASIYTSVAKAADVDSARLKLVLLRDALQAPSPLEPNYDMALREEAKERSLSDRWGGWKTHPLWWIHSIMGCPLAEPQHPGPSPHVVLYYTMGEPLVRELVLSVKCFVSRIIGDTQVGSGDTNQSSCNGVRSLDLVMIDVSLHTEELGICTADGSLGLSASEHVSRFFDNPAAHCVGYGRLGSERLSGGSL
ncbi:unnamed protein product [Ectocarpus sp. 13 AM-2016]